LPNEITNAVVASTNVTVVGDRLSIPVIATDDPNCGERVGWWTITITWRAWPAP